MTFYCLFYGNNRERYTLAIKDPLSLWLFRLTAYLGLFLWRRFRLREYANNAQANMQLKGTV